MKYIKFAFEIMLGFAVGLVASIGAQAISDELFKKKEEQPDEKTIRGIIIKLPDQPEQPAEEQNADSEK